MRSDPAVEERRDIEADKAADASLDRSIFDDVAADASPDMVADGAIDAPTGPDAPDAHASDAHADNSDAGDTPDAIGATDSDVVADVSTSDAPTSDAPTSDAATADAPAADAPTADAPTADAPTADTLDPADADAGAADVAPTDVYTPGTDAPDTDAVDAPIGADVAGDAVDDGADGGLPNKIFVTSISYPSDLGGLEGADEKCRQRAQAAGLSGTFVALLSTSTVSARSRLGAARGWIRTDGKPFADRQQDLFSSALTAIDSARTYYPPNLDEFGNVLPSSAIVMTGTLFDGTLDPRGDSCSDWTSSGPTMKAFGSPRNGAHGYIAAGWSSCPYQSNLLCIEISRTSRVDPPLPPPARRTAFVSVGYYYPVNGMVGADAICASDAAAAGLAGTYRALLATTQASAMSRFDIAGPPWVRVDGVVLAATASDFAAGSWLAPLNVTARGAHLANYAVWVGAPGPSAVGFSTCNDWNPTDPSSQGGTTTIAYSGETSWWRENSCDSLYGRVFCLQQ